MADVNQIYLIGSSISRYGSFIVYPLGLIGAIINIIIFSTDKDLKKTTCSPLFLASSITSTILLFLALVTICFGLFNLNLTYTNDGICKVYIFFLYGLFCCVALFTSYLSIERWLSSSRNATLRHLSSIKNAYRAVIITIIIISILCSQTFYCFLANRVSTRGQCSPVNIICTYINDFIIFMMTVFVPCSIMFIFGLLTLSNIRQSINRTQPIEPLRTTKRDRRFMKIQSTITIMMFTQVFLLLFCNIASGIQKVYTTITGNDYKSPERRAIETAIFQTVFLINYIGAGLPFYMYTLTGAVFRQALFRLIYMIFHCNRARQEVAPSQGSN